MFDDPRLSVACRQPWRGVVRAWRACRAGPTGRLGNGFDLGGRLIHCTEGDQSLPLRVGDALQARDVDAFVTTGAPQYTQTSGTAGFPEAHRLVKASAGHQVAVGRERHAADHTGVAPQGY